MLDNFVYTSHPFVENIIVKRWSFICNTDSKTDISPWEVSCNQIDGWLNQNNCHVKYLVQDADLANLANDFNSPIPWCP